MCASARHVGVLTNRDHKPSARGFVLFPAEFGRAGGGECHDCALWNSVCRCFTCKHVHARFVRQRINCGTHIGHGRCNQVLHIVCRQRTVLSIWAWISSLVNTLLSINT